MEINRVCLAAVVFVLSLCFLAGSADALIVGSTNWVHDPGSPGSWHDQNNWDNGLPGSSQEAYTACVTNNSDAGGTAEITLNADQCNLTLGQGAERSRVDHISGAIHIECLDVYYGWYVLSDGILTTDTVCMSEWHGAWFDQHGGTHNVNDTLHIGGTNGAGWYDFYAGRLNVANLSVEEAGVLHLYTNDADIYVSESIHFMDTARYWVDAGTTIHMTGANFITESHAANPLYGLGSTTFLFEGGEGVIDTFEVFCDDMGDTLDGFEYNIVTDCLVIGGSDVGYVQLVDEYDNGNRGGVAGDAEALYVDSLIINDGSTLDLNGYHLYTRYFDVTYGGNVIGGEVTVVVPEPATLALLIPALAGIGALLRKRRGIRVAG